MKKIEIPASFDNNGDCSDDMMFYSIEHETDCGPFVPAAVIEECRKKGLAYVCLGIPGAGFNVMIEVDGHSLQKIKY